MTVEMLTAAARVLTPPELISPSEWARRYRYLKEGTTERPGRWSSDVFPYLDSIMDAIQEALETGKRGVVLMKSGQGGGSEAMINVTGWLRDRYSGAMLYMISKDELAKEFGRERFSYMIETSEPLAAKALRGRGEGELLQVKRFTNGKLVVQGGRSVLNLQTTPYRFVLIDEVDSLLDEIEGHGDPIKLAEIRTDAFSGDTLIIAFAHPSTRERGAGRLYYDLSDQRRGTAPCPHCGSPFWLSLKHIVPLAKPGQTEEQARRDVLAYHYVTPCCGAILTDSQRMAMASASKQVSTLAPEIAKAKTWIGVHFGQAYMRNKPVSFLAEKIVEALDDEKIARVVANKREGDVYEPKVRDTKPDDWRACIVIPRSQDDRDAYSRGQVPPAVRYLTAGQDSRETELHWTVWGWGLERTSAGHAEFCGWLIDYGTIRREKSPTLEASDLAPLSQFLYDVAYPRTDGDGRLYVSQAGHDAGWCPVGVYQFCRRFPGRAIPTKGAAEDSNSAAPFLRWGASPTWRVNGIEVHDETLRQALLNTYVLKEQLFGMVGKRFEREDGTTRTRITLPRDVGSDFIEQASSEFLAKDRTKLVWRHKGPNHLSDCTVISFALGLQLNPFEAGRTRDEFVAKEKLEVEHRRTNFGRGKGGNSGGWKIGR